MLIAGIASGTFLSKLFIMILLKLLGTSVNVGMTFSVSAIVNTLVVLTLIILFTSIQGYRLIYKFKLIELFRAEQEGEHEPKTFVAAAILSVVFLVIGYWFAFQTFSNNKEILTNLSVMLGGIILATALLFSSLVIFLLKMAKRSKRSYYKGMNLVGISNLVYRIKGNARTLCVISLLSAIALCAVSVGFGLYYSFDRTARLTAPFSYMYIAQDKTFNETVDSIIRADADYQKVEAQVSPTTYVGYSVQDQKTAKKTIDTLASIKTSQSKVSTFYSVYRLGIEEAAFNVFILGFLGLVFIMATGSIIYFKQLTEANADKTRYEILNKIGVSKKEINTSILKQNAFIFILPLAVGLAHYIVILNLLKKMISGTAGVNFTQSILVCVAAFILIYAVYYIITVNSIFVPQNFML